MRDMKPGALLDRRFIGWLFLAVVVIVLDQMVKAWVASHFAYGDGVIVSSFFNLVYVRNHGAAFSFLADAGGWQRWFFVALAAAVSAWLIATLHRHRREALMASACAFILGGAIGNVIDRVTLGSVVDFLDFHTAGYHFPAFNLADSAITLGVILMLLHQLLDGRKERNPA